MVAEQSTYFEGAIFKSNCSYKFSLPLYKINVFFFDKNVSPNFANNSYAAF